MTTLAFPSAPRLRDRLKRAAGVIAGTTMTVLAAKSRPIAAHLRDHGYSIAGFAFIDGAAFDHSVFTGLLITGISFLVFEWKVSD